MRKTRFFSEWTRHTVVLYALVLPLFITGPAIAQTVVTEPLRTLEHDNSVVSLSVSNDGSQLLAVSLVLDGGDSAGADGCFSKISLWDISEGELLRTFPATGALSDPCVLAVDFSPDGTKFATGGSDGTVSIWSIATGEILRTFSGHADLIGSVAYSPLGTSVLTGSADNTARVWDESTGELLQTLTHGERIWSAVYSKNAQKVLTCSSDRTAKLWDVGTGTLLGQFIGHGDWVMTGRISEDGQRVVTGSWDQTVRVWETATQSTVQVLEYEDRIWDVRFLADESQVLAGANDGVAVTWSIDSGVRLREFQGHTRAINAVAVLPGDSQIATGSDDTNVLIWAPVVPVNETLLRVPVSPFIETVTDRFTILDAYEVPERITFVDGIRVKTEPLDSEPVDVLTIGRTQFLSSGVELNEKSGVTGYVVVLYDAVEGNHAVVHTTSKNKRLEILGFENGVLFVHLVQEDQIVRITGDWGEGIVTSGNVQANSDLNDDGRVDALDLIRFGARWHQAVR